jgi:hypothetical protein
MGFRGDDEEVFQSRSSENERERCLRKRKWSEAIDANVFEDVLQGARMSQRARSGDTYNMKCGDSYSGKPSQRDSLIHDYI